MHYRFSIGIFSLALVFSFGAVFYEVFLADGFAGWNYTQSSQFLLIISSIIGLGFILLFTHIARFPVQTPFGQRINRLGRWWFILGGIALVLGLIFSLLAFVNFLFFILFFVIIIPASLYLLVVEPIRLPVVRGEEIRFRRALLAIPLAFVVTVLLGDIIFEFIAELLLILDFIFLIWVLMIFMRFWTYLFVLVPIYLLINLSKLRDSQMNVDDTDLDLYKQNPA